MLIAINISKCIKSLLTILRCLRCTARSCPLEAGAEGREKIPCEQNTCEPKIPEIKLPRAVPAVTARMIGK